MGECNCDHDCNCWLADEDWRDEPDLHAVRWNGHIVLVNRLTNLAANLAVAAGLTRAHDLGHSDGYDCAAQGEGYDTTNPWRPNSNSKAAPGFEGK